MRKIIVLLAFVFMAGCQSPEQIAASWEGSNINELIASWGPPTQVIDNGPEGRIMAWRKGGSVQMPGTASTSYYGMSSHTTYQPGPTIHVSSAMTFWVRPNGIIYRSSYSRN